MGIGRGILVVLGVVWGLLAMAPGASAASRPLESYASLVRALDEGASVRAVLHYAQMTLTVDGKEVPAPDAVGGMPLTEWERFAAGVVRNPKAYVAASETVLIAHPRYGHVLNYVRLRIYEDGAVEVTARYLMPTTYEVVMDETFRGRIAGRDKKGGVRLFQLN